MRILTYKQNAAKARFTNNVIAVALLLSVIMNFALVISMLTKKEQTRLVPLSAPAESYSIGWNGSTLSYRLAIARNVVAVLGGLTPETLDYVQATIRPLLAPEDYATVVQDMNDYLATIKKLGTKLTASYQIHDAYLDTETGKIYVVGWVNYFTEQGPLKPIERSYEMNVRIVRGLPKIFGLKGFDGVPEGYDL